MFVRWNEKGTKVIDLVRTKRDTTIVQTEKGPAEKGMVPDPELMKIKTRRETIMLGPGVNEITREEFALAKPSIKRELKARLIQELRHPVTSRKPKEGESAEKITDLSVDDAINMIGQVGPQAARTIVPNYGNRDTLYRWLAQETRENVTLAIFARLRFLGLLSEIDERAKKPDPKDLAVARSLVAEESSGELSEEDYVEEVEPALAE
jgi:hypothetical protein